MSSRHVRLFVSPSHCLSSPIELPCKLELIYLSQGCNFEPSYPTKTLLNALEMERNENVALEVPDVFIMCWLWDIKFCNWRNYSLGGFLTGPWSVLEVESLKGPWSTLERSLKEKIFPKESWKRPWGKYLLEAPLNHTWRKFVWISLITKTYGLSLYINDF